jgi:hypothetical protein
MCQFYHMYACCNAMWSVKVQDKEWWFLVSGLIMWTHSCKSKTPDFFFIHPVRLYKHSKY